MATLPPVLPEPMAQLSSLQARDAGAHAHAHAQVHRAAYPANANADAVAHVSNSSPPPAGTMPQSAHSQSQPLTSSQESCLSAPSTASTAPHLQSSSSNLSTSTAPDTELTSPAVSTAATDSDHRSRKSDAGAVMSNTDQATSLERPTTPRIESGTKDGHVSGGTSATTSPDTPYLSHGTKRTASGVVKSAAFSEGTSPMSGTQLGHVSNASRDLNQSRIGELSVQLKTRLSYAMVKVQNGWEKRSIDELEGLPSKRTTPTPSTPAIDRPNPYSPYTGISGNSARRPSVISNISDQYVFSPNSQTSPAGGLYSRSLPYTSASGPSSPCVHNAPWASQTMTGGLADNHTPALAPAPEIVSRRTHRRSVSAQVPPMLSSSHSSGDGYGSGAGNARRYNALTSPASLVTTDGSPRHARILRMPSQQAEKDAVDTLLFMSSPNNSANMKFARNADSQGAAALTAAITMAQPNLLDVESSSRVMQKRVEFEQRPNDGEGPDYGAKRKAIGLGLRRRGSDDTLSGKED